MEQRTRRESNLQGLDDLSSVAIYDSPVPSRYDARNFIARQSRLPLPLSLSLLFKHVVTETRRASIEFTRRRKVPLDFRLGDGSKTMDLGRRWFDTREGDGVNSSPSREKEPHGTVTEKRN